eukprot:4918633-Lingulodinium_polyedra.AAC.1
MYRPFLTATPAAFKQFSNVQQQLPSNRQAAVVQQSNIVETSTQQPPSGMRAAFNKQSNRNM